MSKIPDGKRHRRLIRSGRVPGTSANSSKSSTRSSTPINNGGANATGPTTAVNSQVREKVRRTSPTETAGTTCERHAPRMHPNKPVFHMARMAPTNRPGGVPQYHPYPVYMQHPMYISRGAPYPMPMYPYPPHGMHPYPVDPTQQRPPHMDPAYINALNAARSPLRTLPHLAYYRPQPFPVAMQSGHGAMNKSEPLHQATGTQEQMTGTQEQSQQRPPSEAQQPMFMPIPMQYRGTPPSFVSGHPPSHLPPYAVALQAQPNAKTSAEEPRHQ